MPAGSAACHDAGTRIENTDRKASGQRLRFGVLASRFTEGLKADAAAFDASRGAPGLDS